MGVIANTRSAAQVAIDAALSWIGTPYKYGGNDPLRGIDCSGLTQQAFARAGIQLPRTTYDQVKLGAPVASIDDAQPGDLVFGIGDGNRVNGHVEIYLGGGKAVVAPHTGTNVQIQPVNPHPTAIRRIIGSGPATADPSTGPAAAQTAGFSLTDPLGSVGALITGVLGDAQHAAILALVALGGVALVVLGAHRSVTGAGAGAMPGMPASSSPSGAAQGAAIAAAL